MSIFADMQEKLLLDSREFHLTLIRLCHQLIENYKDFSNTAIIGIQPRGIFVSERIVKHLRELVHEPKFNYGKLDITFYRDDFRRREEMLLPQDTILDFSIEGKKVILVDDVLYTGRTIRSALDSLLDYGRPKQVELLVLIDRRFSRHLPIQADYIGKTIDSIESEKVKVHWSESNGEDKVFLLTERQNR